MEPLAFHPILQRIRWGGRHLGTVLGKPIGDGTDYAESWEIADHGDDQTRVDGGPFDGWTLAQLVREKNRELFGRHAGLAQFPLLVKFLDAADRLSVQVHPNDEQAVKFNPRENGKTETWVIVEADPLSRLYCGLKAGVDKKTLADAVQRGGIESCLHSFTVHKGDCVFVPAGTVHAIGEGVLLAEIQQSSDLTFRLYDWGRLGSDGKPRPLHLSEALACIDFQRGPVNPVEPRVIDSNGHRLEELVRSKYFVILRHTAEEPVEFDPDDRVHILMTLDGDAQLRFDDQIRDLKTGQTLLLPASGPRVQLIPGRTVVLLEACLP